MDRVRQYALPIALGVGALDYMATKNQPPPEGPLGRPRKAFPRPPGRGAPLFHGVRVVEISTMVAAPAAGRILADLGAEVVKVEDPVGDMWRTLVASPRHTAPVFEMANAGKTGITLDLRSADGQKVLHQLLQNADVLITNVRADGLRRLKLTYEDLHERYPTLIYAHLSAWGTTGPGKSLPGYDIGAFWAATGMAASFQTGDRMGLTTAGFGDVVTGSELAGCIAVALTHRLNTGVGLQVSTALLRVGLWCMAAEVLRDNEGAGPGADALPDYKVKTTQDPLWRTYSNRDGTVAVSGKGEDALRSFRKALGVGESLQGGVEVQEALEAACRNLSTTEFTALLQRCNIPCTVATPFVDLPKLVDSPLFSGTYTIVPGAEDMHVVHSPFDASCSVEHGPRFRAPLLDEDTAEWRRRLKKGGPDGGWTVALPTPELLGAGRGQRLLEGITVVELSGDGLSVSATGALLVDRGATVIKVEPPGGDPWREESRALFQHLNRGKHSVTIDLTTASGRESLWNLLESANAFLTNWRSSDLQAVGVDPDTVQQQLPELLYGSVTPYGLGSPDDPVGDVGAWWAATGMFAVLSDPILSNPQSRLPKQLGELMTSIHFYTAVTSGLFHQRRTGEGQVVATSLFRSAMWSLMMVFGVFEAEPALEGWLYLPIMSRPGLIMGAYETKDGVWLQLYGLSVGQHMTPTLKAVNIRGKVYREIVKGLGNVLGNKPPAGPDGAPPHVVVKLAPLFRRMNEAMTEGMRKLTYAECVERFKEFDIWYCRVETPQQAFHHYQARATRTFAQTRGGVTVLNAPGRFAGCAEGRGTLPDAPEAGMAAGSVARL